MATPPSSERANITGLCTLCKWCDWSVDDDPITIKQHNTGVSCDKHHFITFSLIPCITAVGCAQESAFTLFWKPPSWSPAVHLYICTSPPSRPLPPLLLLSSSDSSCTCLCWPARIGSLQCEFNTLNGGIQFTWVPWLQRGADFTSERWYPNQTLPVSVSSWK